MTSRLSLYNGALLLVGERGLSTLTDDVEPRRLLDLAWGTVGGGALDACLGMGQWKFAKRTVMLSPDPSISPAFGYGNAFAIPDDFVRTCALCSDENLNAPLTDYRMEGDYWYAWIEPIYVSYVSNDATCGGDLSRWPPEFVSVVEAYLAEKIALKLLEGEAKWKRAKLALKEALRDAKAADAMEGPPEGLPTSRFVAARQGARGGGWADRGSRNRLIG